MYFYFHNEVNFYIYIRIKLLSSNTWENFDDAVTVGNTQTVGDSAVTVYKNHLEQNGTNMMISSEMHRQFCMQALKGICVWAFIIEDSR